MTCVPLASLAKKVVHLGHRAVEGRHGEPVVVHVQNQVLAHHGQPNNSDISFRFHTFVSVIPVPQP